jgi:hypothetical protein
MKTLWAVVLTGLLGLSAVSRGAEPVMPVPPRQDAPTVGPTAPAGGGATNCGACTKSCGTCGCCGFGRGKCREWLSYHPCWTRFSECGPDYLIPPNYTFFLDGPCRPTWKPVPCCDNHCGSCAHGSCGCGAPPVPVAAPVPAPPAPEQLPTMPKIAPGR